MKLQEQLDEIILLNSVKKVVVYGAGYLGVNALLILKKCGKQVSYIVDSDETKQGQFILGVEIRSPYDLLYESKDNMVIFVTVNEFNTAEVTKILEGMGYEYNKHYFKTLDEERYAPFQYVDPILSYSRGELDFEQVPVEVNGDDNEQEKVILILGGSTTDGSFYGINSWPYYLQQHLGKKVKIYNGGICGYTSSQELLKLVRDGLTSIKPDLVISYSGVNDSVNITSCFTHQHFSRGIMKNLTECYKKYVGDVPNAYYGKEEESAKRYVTNIRMMNGICREFGCDFVAILQPTMVTGKKYKMNELEMEFCKLPVIDKFIDTSMRFYNQVVNSIKEYSYIYDFTQIFNEESECFYEWIHCTEKGNAIVAKKVYEILESIC